MYLTLQKAVLCIISFTTQNSPMRYRYCYYLPPTDEETAVSGHFGNLLICLKVHSIW